MHGIVFDCEKDLEWRSLKDLQETESVSIQRGKVISKTALQETPGDYPVYSSSATGNGEFGRYGKYMYDDERITWSIDGGGRFFYRPAHKYSITNVCGGIKINTPQLLTKFAFYSLEASWSNKVYDYMDKALPTKIVNDYIIPIPPLPVQQLIVDTLDKFSEITEGIQDGLPKEIELSHKQYEYYRDKLLAFPKKESDQ